MNTIPEAIQALDEAVLHWAQGALGQSGALDFLLRVVGQWLVYLVPIALLLAWFYLRYGSGLKNWPAWRADLILFTAAGMLGWQVLSRIVKLFYFRERPSVAGENVKELFFHRPDESFPSDHAALFFGFATYAYLRGWKSTGHLMTGIALAVSLARIVTGTHWLTDILGGLVIGVASAYLIYLPGRWLRAHVAEPLERFLARLGL
ncbi:phosphatase PAP2 family protein [Candidatus Berkelbacteria bacterium]|nr:phosphatase PAP2 family protein [Candidatus Berkelbacteria bacterium]